jgi:hypothetical protein
MSRSLATLLKHLGEVNTFGELFGFREDDEALMLLRRDDAM